MTDREKETSPTIDEPNASVDMVNCRTEIKSWFHKMTKQEALEKLTVLVSSGVRHKDCNLSSFLRARLTFSKMSEAVAVQMKGLGLSL